MLESTKLTFKYSSVHQRVDLCVHKRLIYLQEYALCKPKIVGLQPRIDSNKGHWMVWKGKKGTQEGERGRLRMRMIYRTMYYFSQWHNNEVGVARYTGTLLQYLYGTSVFLRETRITKFYTDIYTNLVFSRTRYDATSCFRSAPKCI